MALLFQTPIVTNEGIEISNAYGRVGVVDAFVGTSIEEYCNIYASEAAFTMGAAPLNTQLLLQVTSAYDRTTQGVDILDIAHDHLIASLATQGVVATKSL